MVHLFPNPAILFSLALILGAGSRMINFAGAKAGMALFWRPPCNQETFGTAAFPRNDGARGGFRKQGWVTHSHGVHYMTNQNNQSGQNNNPQQQKYQNQPQSGQQAGQQQRQPGQQGKDQSGQQSAKPDQSGQQGNKQR
jgi:hypothetical protein